jgi:hypothetical protein
MYDVGTFGILGYGIVIGNSNSKASIPHISEVTGRIY